MMDRLRFWFAKRLRYLADRIDDEHAMVAGVGYFYIQSGRGLVIERKGVQIHPEPSGVQIWYRRDEYKKKGWRD